MTPLTDTPDLLVLEQRAGRTRGVVLGLVAGMLITGVILLAIAPASGAVLVLAPLGGALLLFALAWLALLAFTVTEVRISFDRPADLVTFRRRALLRTRHDTLPLPQITGVAVERAARQMRQETPDSETRRTVTDIAYRPVLLLLESTRHPLLATYTNETTATAPAETVLRWLTQDPTAQPPMVDFTPPSA